MKKANAALKCRKAVGLDSLQADLLKYGSDRVHQEPFKYISANWSSEIIPSQWKDSNVNAMYKRKGEKTQCGKSRGISLLSFGSKIDACLLLLRLIQHVSEKVLPESQCEFCEEQSKINMTLVLRVIQKKCREQHRDIFYSICTPIEDFRYRRQRAFVENLRKIGCRPKFTKVIKACVFSAGETSDLFRALAGAQRSCCLAPLLFNLFVSAVLQVFHGRLGRRKGIPVRYSYDDGELFTLTRLKARRKGNSVIVNEFK